MHSIQEIGQVGKSINSDVFLHFHHTMPEITHLVSHLQILVVIMCKVAILQNRNSIKISNKLCCYSSFSPKNVSNNPLVWSTCPCVADASWNLGPLQFRTGLNPYLNNWNGFSNTNIRFSKKCVICDPHRNRDRILRNHQSIVRFYNLHLAGHYPRLS